MEFEFDINKSKANKEKHGIDFFEAKFYGMIQTGSKSRQNI